MPLARAVRAATGVPVVASQRITHPTLAEHILEAGDADLIGMARALIADHCDLSDVATLETAICDELAAQAPSCPESQRRRLRVVLVRLFEGGLAVGLAATAPVVGASA